MDFEFAASYLNWLEEQRDITPRSFLEDAQTRLGRVPAETELVDLVLDLIDDGIVESSMGKNIEEDYLPLRVRLTSTGRRVVRKFSGRVDRWQDQEGASAGAAGQYISIGGDVSGSQIGQGGRDVSQVHGAPSGSPAEQLTELLNRVLGELDSFGLSDDEQDDLEDAARIGIAEAGGEADGAVGSRAARRGQKVLEILGRVGTGAAGSVAAHEIIAQLGPLLS